MPKLSVARALVVTMPTLSRSSAAASLGRLRASAAGRLSRAAREEHGFLLVEVMVSALLVAIIIVATFNGFSAASRLSADQRHRDQAAIVAAESEEDLRTDSASALIALVSNPHKFSKTIGGTTFAVTQEAHPVAASGATGCNANETTSQTSNIQIVTTIKWKAQEEAKRPVVKQVSVISPPTGSALEIDVSNKSTTLISGVTAVATFKPLESGSYATSEGTTGSLGCVVLSGIQALSAEVSIAKKANFVTPAGLLEWESPKTLSIAPNLTKHYPVYYAGGGRFEATFTYKGATTFESKTVTSDTFVAQNAAIGLAPELYVGAPKFVYEVGNEENYRPVTGGTEVSAVKGEYAAKASTAVGAKYTTGDLFPFGSGTPWAVYAGECKANNVGSEAAAKGALVIEQGKATGVEVPVSFVTLKLWKNTQVKPETEEKTSALKVRVSFPECESTIPIDSLAFQSEHVQETTTGRLTVPFQPFGPAKLCIYSPTTKRSYTVSYTNSTAAGSTANVYLGEPSEAERAATKTAAEAVEAAERTKWTKEVSEKKIKSSEKTSKESTQTTNRKAREKTEEEAYPPTSSKKEANTDTIASGITEWAKAC
jgi:type II secretory pathway pseudopilin PulG